MFRKPLYRRDFLKCLDIKSSPHFCPKVPRDRAQWNRREARLSFGVHFEGSFRLHGQADRNIARAIERLQDMIAEQAAELAFGAGSGSQFDAAITGMAVGTGNVGLFHFESMPRGQTAFQPALNTKYSACVRKPTIRKPDLPINPARPQIGRASCRERV